MVDRTSTSILSLESLDIWEHFLACTGAKHELGQTSTHPATSTNIAWNIWPFLNLRHQHLTCRNILRKGSLTRTRRWAQQHCGIFALRCWNRLAGATIWGKKNLESERFCQKLLTKRSMDRIIQTPFWKGKSLICDSLVRLQTEKQLIALATLLFAMVTQMWHLHRNTLGMRNYNQN